MRHRAPAHPQPLRKFRKKLASRGNQRSAMTYRLSALLAVLPTHYGSPSSFRVVEGPEAAQPIRNGGVGVKVIAWGITLDVDDGRVRPGVDAVHPQSGAFASQ